MVGLGVVFVMAVVAAATAAVGLMVGVAAVDWPLVADFICKQWIFCCCLVGARKEG